MKYTIKRLLAAMLACVMVLGSALSLTGCSMPDAGASNDLMKGIKAKEMKIDINLEDFAADYADFSTELFKKSIAAEGENGLVSPISVLCALSMTMNGAEGETLRQMEEAIGMTAQEANECLLSYIDGFMTSEEVKIHLANSMWLKQDENFTVEKDFLQKNADYHKAAIYEEPFDNSTLRQINGWIEDNTDGMIKDMLQDIPEEVIMYLVNALAFDAQWANVYNEMQVHENTFHNADGSEKTVDFMYSTEWNYIEDENAKGFVKAYNGGTFGFAALMPDEGTDIRDYAASLTGERLLAAFKNASYEEVHAGMPKFETEYSVDMSEILESMGMKNAFDVETADFSKLGTYKDKNIYISKVLHKTFIEVGEQGTRAGAATVVAMANGAAFRPEEPKEVILDRPFVYMIVDMENYVPLFIGVMENMK